MRHSIIPVTFKKNSFKKLQTLLPKLFNMLYDISNGHSNKVFSWIQYQHLTLSRKHVHKSHPPPNHHQNHKPTVTDQGDLAGLYCCPCYCYYWQRIRGRLITWQPQLTQLSVNFPKTYESVVLRKKGGDDYFSYVLGNVD